MRKKGKNLEFISCIKRDGSGTIKVGTEWNKKNDSPKTDDVSYLDEDYFLLTCLSLKHKTYIANGVNSWIVKLKE